MPSDKPSVAVLDDYANAARSVADWTPLLDRADVHFFSDHLSDEDALAERLAPFAVVVVMRERTPLTRSLIARLPALRLIASTGPSNAAIDADAARERGIEIAHTGAKGHGALELTWALILAAIRNLPAEIASVRAGGWQAGLGGDLNGTTLGIAGLGRLGSAVARIARAFEMNVIAWSPNLTPERAAAAGVRAVDRETLLREADVLTVHLVLGDATRGIFDADAFARMKRSAWFVNTSRGPIADEAALVEALRTGRIAGAALDVYATEPLPPDHPLRSLRNVIASPHIGFVTRQSYEVLYGETVANISTWLDRRVTAPVY